MKKSIISFFLFPLALIVAFASFVCICFAIDSSESKSADVLYGDVNGDSRISAMDLLQIQKHLLKMITLKDAYALAADVNKDGRISAMDLLQVQKHLLKMIVIA